MPDSPTSFKSASEGLNPYQPPSVAATPEELPSSDQQPSRPIGVSILAILHGLGSVAILVLFVVLAATFEAQNWAAGSGLPLLLVVAVGAVCGGLGLASAYGMWTGAKWGWWLSAWYYVTAVVGHGLTLTIAPLQLRRLDEDEFQEFLIKHSGRLVISSLLALYLFRRNVMRFFGLQLLKRWKAAGILVASSLVFMVAFALLIVAGLFLSRLAAS